MSWLTRAGRRAEKLARQVAPPVAVALLRLAAARSGLVGSLLLGAVLEGLASKPSESSSNSPPQLEQLPGDQR